MKKILMLLTFFLFFNQVVFAEAKVESNPNIAYEKGNFEQAVKDYKSLLDSGIENAELYYNLGNAYYQLQDYGRAYAFYSKAELLSPRDSDIRHNLELAKNRLSSNSERLDQQNLVGFLNKVVSFQGYLNDFERNLILIILFTIFGSFIFIDGLRILKGQNPQHKASSTIFLLLFLSWSFTVFTSRPGINGSRVFSLNSQAREIRPGIIIENQTKIYSGAGKEFQVVSVLDSGIAVEALDVKNNWIKIALPAGRIGWVSLNSIELL
jgi:tetratricopeptide (TPR) repeat protein